LASRPSMLPTSSRRTARTAPFMPSSPTPSPPLVKALS
jgi:hypothetical protein